MQLRPFQEIAIVEDPQRNRFAELENTLLMSTQPTDKEISLPSVAFNSFQRDRTRIRWGLHSCYGRRRIRPWW